jgi:hypothetical protein
MVAGITEDDVVIENLIDEVTNYLETYTNRYILTQSVTVYLDSDEMKSEIYLPCVPLVSVTSITTTDDDGSDTVVNSTNYQVRAGENPRITLTQSGSWPTDARTYDGMAIVCVVGSNGSVLPAVGFEPTSTTVAESDDLVAGGTFTGTSKTSFEVKIEDIGSPDTFKNRKITRDGDGVKTVGDWSSETNITGSAQDLDDGITATFGSTTNHTIGSVWNIQLYERIPRRIKMLIQGLVVHFYMSKGRGINETVSGQLIGLPHQLRSMMDSLRVTPWV